jgi:hypothetical protein
MNVTQHKKEAWTKLNYLIDVEVFDEIQHPFMMKAPNKPGIEEMYLNIIKATNVKPTLY